MITAKRKYEEFRIYFDDILHLQLKLNDLIGFQSWIHGEKEFYIEYYFINNSKITTAYGEKERWKTVLKLLEEHVTVKG